MWETHHIQLIIENIIIIIHWLVISFLFIHQINVNDLIY